MTQPVSGGVRPPPVSDATLKVEAVRMRQITAVPLPGTQAGRAPFRPTFDDHFRFALTGWQSAGLTVAIAALVVGALGMAASGWVAAYHWSCRTGLATTYCTPVSTPHPQTPALPDIPT
ncbi:MAG TPA: hypothetical protein VNL39_03585 [Xanthobacteraceae bacterium]|nr:hypothetical protein [Xanthobacteraceae bacterium]